MMNRRGFFKALALGGAAVPRAFSVVSRPATVGALWLRSGQHLVGQTFRVAGVLVDGAQIFVHRCRFILPWGTRQAVKFTGRAFHATITESEFLYEPQPLWARLLRVTR